MATPTNGKHTIALNRRASFDYELGQRFEAGLVLEGWEVKSIRESRAQIADSYVLVRNGEAWLLGARIAPTPSVSTHFTPDPTRTRKLLLHGKEIARIFSAVETRGQACVATALYWKDAKVKCELALGKGKKTQDKRTSIREREWRRDQERQAKHGER